MSKTTKEEVLKILQGEDFRERQREITSVMMYSRWADTLQQANNIGAIVGVMDAMSAVTHVIDMEKIRRGLNV